MNAGVAENEEAELIYTGQVFLLYVREFMKLGVSRAGGEAY